MRKYTFLSVIAALFALCSVLAGCKSARSISYGRANEGYVQFVGSQYSSVTVIFDDDVKITAKVNKSGEKVSKNDNTYAVTPGAHKVEVFDNKGNTILVKQIFVSAQEIRTVSLP